MLRDTERELAILKRNKANSVRVNVKPVGARRGGATRGGGAGRGATRGRGRGGNRGGNRGGGRGGARTGNKDVSQDTLDAQLDSYMLKTKGGLDAQMDEYMSKTKVRRHSLYNTTRFDCNFKMIRFLGWVGQANGRIYGPKSEMKNNSDSSYCRSALRYKKFLPIFTNHFFSRYFFFVLSHFVVEKNLISYEEAYKTVRFSGYTI